MCIGALFFTMGITLAVVAAGVVLYSPISKLMKNSLK